MTEGSNVRQEVFTIRLPVGVFLMNKIEVFVEAFLNVYKNENTVSSTRTFPPQHIYVGDTTYNFDSSERVDRVFNFIRLLYFAIETNVRRVPRLTASIYGVFFFLNTSARNYRIFRIIYTGRDGERNIFRLRCNPVFPDLSLLDAPFRVSNISRRPHSVR